MGALSCAQVVEYRKCLRCCKQMKQEENATENQRFVVDIFCFHKHDQLFYLQKGRRIKEKEYTAARGMRVGKNLKCH